MEEYIKWLENKMEVCLEDKDLQREHWAFCQALKKYRELALRQPLVMESDCDHEWINHSFDHFGFLQEQICDKCGARQSVP